MLEMEKPAFKSLENAVNNKMETRQFLNENGEVLGFAKIIYFESPFPFYFVVRFEINEDKRGEGYGKEMLLQFNKFLQDSNKVGILIDSIDENKPSSGMYARNGWKKVPEHKGWHTFNMSENFSQKDLAKYIEEIAQKTMFLT